MHQQQCVLAPGKCTQFRREFTDRPPGSYHYPMCPVTSRQLDTVVHVLLVDTLRFLWGCIPAITFHRSFSRVL